MDKRVLITETTKDDLVRIITEEVAKEFKQIIKDNRRDFESKPFLTTRETENILRVSKVTLWSWTKEGRIQCQKVGNRLRYRRSDVMDLLDKIEAKRA